MTREVKKDGSTLSTIIYGQGNIQVLRVNTSKVYELINTGQLPYLLLGQKKIRGSNLEQFIEKYPVAQPEEGGNHAIRSN